MNILIVDDEAMIREWLEYTIMNLPISPKNLTLASDGFEAMEKLTEKTYDLVLVDIKMPRMDGIELIKEMSNLPYAPMIVVLSSHEQFNYAREAFQYNAKEYILKSECSKEKLLDILTKCQKDMEKKEMVSDLNYYRFTYLNSVIANLPIKASLPMDTLFPKLMQSYYFILAYDRKDTSTNELTVSRKINKPIFLGNHRNMTFLAYPTHEPLDDRQINDIIYELSEKYSMNIGSSIQFENILDLPSAIKIAHLAKKKLFYMDDTVLVLKASQWDEEDDSAIKKHCALVLGNIKSNDLDQARDNLSVLHHIIAKIKPKNIPNIKNINYNILSALLIHLSNNTHQVMPDLDALKLKIDQSTNYSEVKAITDEYFYFVSQEHSANQDISSHYVLEAINYIHTKYASIESIAQIANRVHINTDYFSRLFKKEVGVPASTYLMNYKLQMAAEKLINTSDTVYEIALGVGYQNISYFSKIFKAKYKLQPSQYRKQHQ